MRPNIFPLLSVACLTQTRSVIGAPSSVSRSPCPHECRNSRSGPSQWGSFHRLQDLENCGQPILFNRNSFGQFTDSKAETTLQACALSADEDETSASLSVEPRDAPPPPPGFNKDDVFPGHNCWVVTEQIEGTAYLGSGTSGSPVLNNPNDISTAAHRLAAYMRTQDCGDTALLAKVGDSVLGLYSGAEIHSESAANLIESFQDKFLGGAQSFQVCDGRSAGRTLGLFAGSVSDLKSIDDALELWGNSECLNNQFSTAIPGLTIDLVAPPIPPSPFPHPRRAVEVGAAVCSPGDGTYSSEDMPAGTYMDWGLLDLDSLTSGRQYITIVNLTPHRFKLESTHSYQMDVFDWGDIPPGRARQNIAHYTEAAGKNAVDDNGEAYYSIEGTDKKFVIRATTHIPDSHWRRTVIDLTGMGMGQREYLDPAPEVPVTLVITGSESYGFITSLTYGQASWMRDIYDVIGNRTVQHIIMPGSHDAGMSTISNQIMSLGSAANTQTQALNIYDQLRVGSRWFDLRIMSIHQTGSESDYTFWIAHVNDETAEVPVGNTGESLGNVISEINQFTVENPGEVLFLRLRYLIGIRKIPSGGPIYWNNDIVRKFFDQLKQINNRCGNLDTGVQFQHQKTSYFMDQNDGAGCVVILLVGDHLKEGVQRSSVSDGLYAAEQMSVNDNWSNLADTQPMAEDQITDWSAIQRISPFRNDQFLISQWLVSADAVTTTALTLQNIAILPTNPSLYWAGINGMSPTKWPNVLLVDYIGVVVTNQFAWNQLSAELYTLAIGLNLYMISENCDINTQRSPVLVSSTSAKSTTKQNAASQWNGIIFANGTVIDHPPQNLHLGRVEILKKGTIFNNGTALMQDIPNPNYNSSLL